MNTEKSEHVEANPMNTGNVENPSTDLTSEQGIYELFTMPEYQAGELLLREIMKDTPDMQFVKDLFEYSKVYANWQNETYETALMWATRKGHTEIVKWLLQRPNIDVNLQDVFQVDGQRIVGDEGGRTALMEASRLSYTEIVRLLLERPDIKVNLQDENGDTALLLAMEEDHTEVIKLLLQHPNIDVYIKNNFEYNAIALGLKSDDSEILGLFVDFLMKQTKQ